MYYLKLTSVLFHVMEKQVGQLDISKKMGKTPKQLLCIIIKSYLKFIADMSGPFLSIPEIVTVKERCLNKEMWRMVGFRRKFS